MARQFKAKASSPTSINEAERRLSATITTNSVDRDGDIVDPKGIDLVNFLKNPVLLWAHDAKQMPIGKVENLDVDEKGIVADIKFADTTAGREVFGLYKDGILNAFSIGFVPKRPNGVEPLTREDADGNVFVTGFHIKQSELLELSAVPIPANPEALTRAMKSVSEESLKESFAAQEASQRLEHSDRVVKDEPSWKTVSKTHEDVLHMGGPFGHHYVAEGEMLLHKEGLHRAWENASGGLDGHVYGEELVHLHKHMKALEMQDNIYHLVVKGSEAHVYQTAEEGFKKATEVSVRKTSLQKSITDRGSKGKIPTAVVFGDEPMTEYHLEVLQMQDGEIIEAKILGISHVLPIVNTKATPEDDGAGQADDDANKELGTDEVAPRRQKEAARRERFLAKLKADSDSFALRARKVQ